MVRVKQSRKTTKYKYRKSKGNPNHCPTCGKFIRKKK